jgi:purine-binding chemotaxis protein CheW
VGSLNPTPLQRALGQAPEKATARAERPEKEFFVFKIGELLLGVDSVNAREVTRLGVITPLPRAASFVLGVAGHRGEVLPVIDLLRFFSQGECRSGTRILCFIGVNGAFAASFVADQVVGLRKVFVSDILPAPVGGDVPSEHVQGVLQSSELKATITLLDLPRVLQTSRQRAVSR